MGRWGWRVEVVEVEAQEVDLLPPGDPRVFTEKLYGFSDCDGRASGSTSKAVSITNATIPRSEEIGCEVVDLLESKLLMEIQTPCEVATS